MKNILLYTDTSQIGGAEQHMLLLAQYLDKEQFTVRVACSKSPTLDPWVKKLTDLNIEVIRLNVSHKHDPRHFFTLKKLIREHKIHLLHAHIWNPASGRYAYLAAHATHTPLIVTEHDPFELGTIKEWMKKKLNTHVAKIIAISEANKKLLTTLYPSLKSRITLIHNGIDTTWFSSQLISLSETEKQQLRTQIFQAKPEDTVITCVAELHPRKGQEYLIKAAPLIQKKFPHIRIILVGKGNDHDRLQKLITQLDLTEIVLLIGHRNDVPYILAASDIFVLPSLKEAFGLVLLEAMTAGLPIVATRSGGVPDIIQEGKNGILIEPENEKALSKAIIELLTNKTLKEKMKKENPLRAETFDVKHMVKKVEAIYTDLTSHEK